MAFKNSARWNSIVDQNKTLVVDSETGSTVSISCKKHGGKSRLFQKEKLNTSTVFCRCCEYQKRSDKYSVIGLERDAGNSNRNIYKKILVECNKHKTRYSVFIFGFGKNLHCRECEKEKNKVAPSNQLTITEAEERYFSSSSNKIFRYCGVNYKDGKNTNIVFCGSCGYLQECIRLSEFRCAACENGNEHSVRLWQTLLNRIPEKRHITVTNVFKKDELMTTRSIEYSCGCGCGEEKLIACAYRNNLESLGCTKEKNKCGFSNTFSLNKPAQLYYLKTPCGHFKIGVTNNDVHKRFGSDKKLFESCEVLMTKDYSNGLDCKNDEQYILSVFSEYRTRCNYLKHSKGNTEYFDKDVLGLDYG